MSMEWTPQFPDGSGWDLEDAHIPCFYEHISHEEVDRLRKGLNTAIYRVVTILDYVDQPHKDTYFIKGEHLQEFLERCITPEFFLEVMSIERVESMPSTDEKLT